jgi:hypothetical protein
VFLSVGLTQRMWTHRVEYVAVTRNYHNILIRKFEDKRLLGRSRHMRENKNGIYLRKGFMRCNVSSTVQEGVRDEVHWWSQWLQISGSHDIRQHVSS